MPKRFPCVMLIVAILLFGTDSRALVILEGNFQGIDGVIL